MRSRTQTRHGLENVALAYLDEIEEVARDIEGMVISEAVTEASLECDTLLAAVTKLAETITRLENSDHE